MSDDRLVSLMVAFLSICLVAVTALEIWKQMPSKMIKKDSGSPKLYQLHIIQLFEVDFNFILVVIFGHQLSWDLHICIAISIICNAEV